MRKELYIIYGRSRPDEVFEEIGKSNHLPEIKEWIGKPLPLTKKQVANEVKICKLIVTRFNFEYVWL